ncbi:unnamed protein product [Adineta ricciae]|uniref:Uncharacterized protein n=1 Tax=Adineta ricciae TaxID=249248 RepID=A0A815MDR7_ADIRI|nr:unnamed protein product [Adineta ricciae]
MTSNYERFESDSVPEKQLPSQDKVSTWNTFKHHIPRILITAFIDMFVPLIIYFLLENRIPSVYALLLAGAPPFLMVTYKAIQERSFDAIGFLVCAAFLLAAVSAVLLDDPYILLFEKSFLTGIGVVAFSITLIPFRCRYSSKYQWRPLVYYFYHDLIPINRTEFGLPDSVFDDDQYTERTELRNEMTSKGISRAREARLVYAWLGLFERLYHPTFSLCCKHINKHDILTMTIERKYTLAYIERWKIEHLNAQQSPSTSISCDSNDHHTPVILLERLPLATVIFVRIITNTGSTAPLSKAATHPLPSSRSKIVESRMSTRAIANYKAN